jgi:serine/threonine-protein kinase HipA
MKTGKTIKALVLYNGTLSGVLEKEKGQYRFVYDEAYMNKTGNRPISMTMPFRKEAYESKELFPVFINMLSEGMNKRMQCRMLKIDENDYFSLLLATAKEDSIGPITIKENNEPS